MKSCFVIGPIGDEGSDIRIRSDKIFKRIFSPACKNEGYQKPVRSDHIARTGNITVQIIHHLVKDDLVLADLTDHNPNVYYELAIRHFVRKPVIYLLPKGEKPRFDIGQMRPVHYDQTEKGTKKAREKLQEFIKQVTTYIEDDPVSVGIDKLPPAQREAIFRKIQSKLDKVKRNFVTAGSRHGFSKAVFAFDGAGGNDFQRDLSFTNHGDLASEVEAEFPVGINARFSPSNAFSTLSRGTLVQGTPRRQ